jgi:hypothetical protein
MQTSELNRATIGVANTTGKERRVGSIPGLPGLGSLMAAGIFVALSLMPARADEKSDIAALQAQITALQTQVNTQQAQITTLQTQLATVQSNKALLLGPFVSVNPNGTGLDKGVTGPNIYFTGANIHILSGSGATDDHLSTGGTLTGLGNLIIGYDELFTNSKGVTQTPNRGGSHNLVIGRFNNFTSSAFGGLVAGELNTISAEAASVSGGSVNTASGPRASVSGGEQSTASGGNSSVSGGDGNTASGVDASVSGGSSNTASGEIASVSGGGANTASQSGASVSGGDHNTASGVVSSVSGGDGNTAGGNGSTVIGGSGVTTTSTLAIGPQPLSNFPFP